MMASSAASVPETLTNTLSLSDPSGILEKSAGNLSGSLNTHGPLNEEEVYHLPAIRINILPSAVFKISFTELETYCREVLSIFL